MEERKILTGMLLVALVVSVIGGIVIFDQLRTLNSLTGAVSGQVDLNITTDISISLPGNNAIDFGQGFVDPDADAALLDAIMGQVLNGTWGNDSFNITIRNDGNVGINVTVESDKIRGNESDSFACQGDSICGGSLNNLTGDGLKFAAMTFENEINSCASAYLQDAPTDFINPIGTPNAEVKSCGCLSSASAGDEIALGMVIGIPNDASGFKSATLTISAEESDQSC